MKPYYDDGRGIVIYHGDARAVLPMLGDGKAIVTDQPYGTGWVRGGGGVGEFTAKHERPDWDRWNMEWLELTKPSAWAIFGPNSKASELIGACPSPSSLVWWRKTNPRPNGPPLEPIAVGPIHLPPGIEFPAYNGDTPFHPCQKPLELMTWLLMFIPPHLEVVDPFLGSGTTLLSAKNLGRKAIGCDINEKCCEVAARRLSQEVLNFGITP